MALTLLEEFRRDGFPVLGNQHLYFMSSLLCHSLVPHTIGQHFLKYFFVIGMLFLKEGKFLKLAFFGKTFQQSAEYSDIVVSATRPSFGLLKIAFKKLKLTFNLFNVTFEQLKFTFNFFNVSF